MFTGAPVRLTTMTVATSGTGLQRLVHVGLQRHVCLAAAQALVGGDDQARGAVLDPPGDGVGRKAAEDHGVDRADPRAGQHGVGRLGDHRQVDGHPVASSADALLGLEHIGHAADLGVRLGVGDLLAAVGLGSSPSQMMAMSSARVGRWRSRQLAQAFSTPSANQRMRKSSASNETSLILENGFDPVDALGGDVGPVAVGVALDSVRSRRRSRRRSCAPSWPRPRGPEKPGLRS